MISICFNYDDLMIAKLNWSIEKQMISAFSKDPKDSATRSKDPHATWYRSAPTQSTQIGCNHRSSFPSTHRGCGPRKHQKTVTDLTCGHPDGQSRLDVYFKLCSLCFFVASPIFGRWNPSPSLLRGNWWEFWVLTPAAKWSLATWARFDMFLHVFTVSVDAIPCP